MLISNPKSVKQSSIANYINDSQALKFSLTMLIVMAPLIMVLAQLTFIHGRSIRDIRPIAQDEIYYWHQTLTFMQAGFDGGYYTYNEGPSAATFTRFFAWGPWFPMLQGVFAHLLGWQFHSAVLFNVLCLTFALASFIVLTTPRNTQKVLIIIVISIFSPFLLFLQFAMQESFNQASGILVTALFYRLLYANRSKARFLFYLTFLFLMVISFVRPTWSLLFFPLILFFSPRKVKNYILAALISGIIVIFFFFQMIYLGSDYPNFLDATMKESQGKDSIIEKYLAIQGAVQDNLRLNLLFRWFRSYFWGGDIKLFIYFRFYYMFYVLAIFTTSIIDMFRGFNDTVTRRLWFLHIFISFSMLSVILLFYETGNWADYRLMTYPILFSLLLLILAHYYKLLALLVIPLILMLPAHYTAQRELTIGRFFPLQEQGVWSIDQKVFDSFLNNIIPHIYYDKTIDNPWCNTIFFPYSDGQQYLLEIPGGIGLSFYLPDRVTQHPKSKYILVGNTTEADKNAFKDMSSFVLLGEYTEGKLYYNIKSDCPLNR